MVTFNRVLILCISFCSLSSPQLVHCLFLVNAHRVWHPSVNIFAVEHHLLQSIYELNAEEVAILALAFFKTNTRMKNVGIIEKFYIKLDSRLSSMDSIPLTAYLKVRSGL